MRFAMFCMCVQRSRPVKMFTKCNAVRHSVFQGGFPGLQVVACRLWLRFHTACSGNYADGARWGDVEKMLWRIAMDSHDSCWPNHFQLDV